MAKVNITLKIDARLLKKIKVLAAEQDTSISALMTGLLEEKVKRDSEYENAKERALTRLREGYDLGFTPPTSRDELHER
jgi:hypothetical protein